MRLIEKQIDELRSFREGVSHRHLPSGAIVVDVRGIPLVDGWNKPSTDVHFILPLGYPQAKPDCFWADVELRLANGAMPTASNLTPLPELNEQHLWFSWHATHWSPNRDTVTTYFHVVMNRLRNAQ